MIPQPGWTGEPTVEELVEYLDALWAYCDAKRKPEIIAEQLRRADAHEIKVEIDDFRLLGLGQPPLFPDDTP